MSNDQRPVSNAPFDPTAHKQMTHETSWLGATGRRESRPPRSTDGDGQTDHPLELWGGAPCAPLSEASGTNGLNRGGGRGAPETQEVTGRSRLCCHVAGACRQASDTLALSSAAPTSRRQFLFHKHKLNGGKKGSGGNVEDLSFRKR